MTAGSWIYIGTQGILQGTYETFAAVAAKRFGGTLAGTLTLTAGCGGMGGAAGAGSAFMGDLNRPIVPHENGAYPSFIFGSLRRQATQIDGSGTV